MPYLVKGNALQIFTAFGHPQFVAQTDEHATEMKTRDKDMSRTPFIGTSLQAKQHYNSWRQRFAPGSYTQGNMSAGILQCLFGIEPLKKENEDFEAYKRQYACQHFAYIDDHGLPCGLMLMSRRDDPSQWMIGLVRKTPLAPKYREVVLLSSFDLQDKLASGARIKVLPGSFANNYLLQRVDSSVVHALLNQVFKDETGSINPHFFTRLALITRHLNISDEVSLRDPINFSALNVRRLFADNQTLDLLVNYKLHHELSFTMLADCLSEDSGLARELARVPLIEDEGLVNKNLLRMTLVFYEEKTLAKHRDLLEDRPFVRTLSSFMADRAQIKLISSLYQQAYELTFMKLALSDEAYYSAANRLVDMGLIQHAPRFFENAEKLAQLRYIHSVADEDAKRLCLVFWIKGSLTLDGYKELVAATEKYPLMASTLIDLDRNHFVTNGIIGLQKLALTPRKHLLRSIKHHFFSKPSEQYSAQGLDELSDQELEDAAKALYVLQRSGVTEQAAYRSVIDSDPRKAMALQLFLPQIANINDIKKRKVLIDVLYAGVNRNVAEQGRVVQQITDKAYLPAANNLSERFICVTHLQALGFKQEEIVWAAQEHTEKAACFRQIILRVEAQCKVISQRLSQSASYSSMQAAWRREEATYRKDLYKIAYEAFLNAKVPTTLADATQRIKKVEQDILNIVDPPIKSDIYKALIAISNVLISLLTLGIANYIKRQKTGNPLFFTQTDSGEEIRALSKEMINTVTPDDEANETAPKR